MDPPPPRMPPRPTVDAHSIPYFPPPPTEQLVRQTGLYFSAPPNARSNQQHDLHFPPLPTTRSTQKNDLYFPPPPNASVTQQNNLYFPPPPPSQHNGSNFGPRPQMLPHAMPDSQNVPYFPPPPNLPSNLHSGMSFPPPPPLPRYDPSVTSRPELEWSPSLPPRPGSQAFGSPTGQQFFHTNPELPEQMPYRTRRLPSADLESDRSRYDERAYLSNPQGRRFTESSTQMPTYPLTSVTSAPAVLQDPRPHNLVNTPKQQSKSRIRSLYAKTQKNTFTRIATKVVIGASIGVLTGTLVDIPDFDCGTPEIGGDGDFTEVNNDGVADGTEAAQDQLQPQPQFQSQPTGLEHLQNGSAETTTWMAQQTWQHVTLPALAGPTMMPPILDPTR